MIINGNAINISLADGTVQTCVTSPPYFGLRDYGVDGQIGLEQTPDAYVAQLVAVFREVRRVLRDDGTLWLNLGDSYGTGASGQNFDPASGATNSGGQGAAGAFGHKKTPGVPGFYKQILGIPWRVAFALQADGWYLRQDIIWHKPNPMPESVTDRCTKAHEYIFLLAKSAQYYYDAEAVKEESAPWSSAKGFSEIGQAMRSNGIDGHRNGAGKHSAELKSGRNKRSVWTVVTKPYSGAHFATFPPELITPCILAGAPQGGIVLDPFSGSGTTVATARQLGRVGIGIELNPVYNRLAMQRNAQSTIWE